MFYEDATFPQRELAALVASKVTAVRQLAEFALVDKLLPWVH